MSGRAWQAILLVLCLLVAQAHAQSRGELAAGGGERGTASTRGGDYGRRSPPPSSFGGSSSSYGSEQGSSGFVTTLGGGSATNTRGSSTGSFSSLGGGSTTTQGGSFGGMSGGSATTRTGTTSETTGSGSSGGGSNGGTNNGEKQTLGGQFSAANGGQATGTAGTTSPSGSNGKTTTTLGGQFSAGGSPGGAGTSPGKADTTSPSPPGATTTTTGGTVTSTSGGSATSCGSGGNPSCAGGNSDPVMYGFAGRSFNFIGEVGKIYNIISSQTLQVSMKLKLAQMWDHNGTNMESIGFMYRGYKVLIALDETDTMSVSLQGKQLREKKAPQHHAWRFENGAYIEVTWDRFKPGLGNTVSVLTDVLKMTIWQTPAGIVDEGGFVLPSWLNFGITLLGPPANGVMHGIVGGTYDRYLEGESAVSKPESQLYIPPDEAFHGKFEQAAYEMADYWDTKFPANLYGVQSPDIKERSSLEIDMPNQEMFPAFARMCFLCAKTPSGQSHTF